MFSDIVNVLCAAHFLILITLTNGSTVKGLRPSASDFKRHTIVQPVVQHARTKRHISTTKDNNGDHHSEVTMKITIDGVEFILDLRLNQDLLSDNHVLTYQENGKTVVHKPNKQEIDLCHYGGTVRDEPGSWVALSTCHGVQGIVFDGERMRYIEPAQGGEITSQHYVYDHSDLTVSHKCGTEGTVHNSTRYALHRYHDYYKELQKRQVSRSKRHAHDTQLHGPYNANELSRYVELVFVADHRQFLESGRNMRTVYRQMKTLANLVNSVFSSLNIFIALVGVVVWNQYDQILLSQNSSVTLNGFLEYRRNVLLKDMPNDNAHLITGQQFGESIIGKAYKSAICSSKHSGGVSHKHTDVLGLQAMTIAHEMGHNFGMEHDDDELCSCPGRKCIMSSSSTSVTPTHWSTCSLNTIAKSFWKGLDYCLRNKPKRLFDYQGPTCGNGFVEPGEQCDCGMTSVVQPHNPCHLCCDPNTCRLRANATCGAGECCDLQTCRLKSTGTVCRSADRECDLPEYCTGHSEFCPDDLYKMDTTPCQINGQSAYCMRGSCRSHESQCRLLWGSASNSSHDKCYHKNKIGDLYGNCGYDDMQDRYVQCASQDTKCGRLQCTSLNPTTTFDTTRTKTGTTTFDDGDAVIVCHTATIDVGLSDVDPGLVPDGAICGHQKMCLNQRCVSVSKVREVIANTEGSVCPSDCSGHGVCNSAGECHCDSGFAPPLCAEPGLGGSLSSGPGTNPAIQHNLMVAMYIIFLGIIPSILLILLLIHHFQPYALIRCNNYLLQQVKRIEYMDKSIFTSKSPIYANTKMPKKFKQKPDIVCNLSNDKTCKDLKNTDNLFKSAEKKSNSVIYENTEFLKGRKTIVSSPYENLHNIPNTHCKNAKIKTSNDTLHYSNLQDIINKTDNIPVKKEPSKIVSTNSNSSQKTTVNIAHSVDSLRATISLVSPRKENIRQKPEITINLTNVKLRKPEMKSSKDNVQSTDNVVNLSNVKLRKTPGNILNATNVNSQTATEKANNLANENQKRIPPLTPIRKINEAKDQKVNNKDFNIKPSSVKLRSNLDKL